MDIKREIQRLDPGRAIRFYNRSAIVEQHCKDAAKHRHAQAFIHSIWNAFIAEISGASVSSLDLVEACGNVIDTLRTSAKLFVQDVFRINLGIEEPEDSDSIDNRRVSWFYAELANYINEHEGLVNIKLLEWAGWKWDYEFEKRIEIPSAIIKELINSISVDNLLQSPRTTRLFSGYINDRIDLSNLPEFEQWNELKRGSDYLEFPDEYLFMVYYLESRKKYEELSAFLSRFEHPVLFDSMLYHVQYPETIINLSDREEFAGIRHQLSLLDHWLKVSMKVTCNMKMYQGLAYDAKVNSGLLSTFQTVASEWLDNVSVEIFKQLTCFEERLRNQNITKWYFNKRWSNNRVENLQTETDQLYSGRIKEFLFNTFNSSKIIYDFLNSGYIAFVTGECVPAKGIDTGGYESLLNLITEYLDEDPLYGNAELNEENLLFLRGFAAVLAHQPKSFVDCSQKMILRYRVRNEGWSISEDIVTAVAREVLVLSAILLTYEMDDKLESERERLFNDTQAYLVQQARTCRYDFLQEKYLLPLQIAELINVQLRKKNCIKEYEESLIKNIANIYLIIDVIHHNANIDEEQKQHLKRRWNEENVGLSIIANQCRKSDVYNAVAQWIGKL